MAERITRAEVNSRVEYINKRLAKANKDWRVQFEHRYDYYGLDKINAKTGATMGFNALKTGTMREVYTYLCGMVEALD